MGKKSEVSIQLFSLILLFLMFFFSCSKKEVGWPRWRGPNGDGISTETDWDPETLADGPKILWKADIGMGFSNVVLKDNRLYTMGLMGIVCLNAETGEEIWKHEIKTIGPNATPAIDGKYLYALTERGILMCLRAKDGKLRWKKNLPSEYDVEVLLHGFATSPVVDGNLIILNLNTSGIALDKKTGEWVWGSEQHKRPPSPEGHYATALCFDYNGVRCSLLFSSGGLYCVETKTGKRLWNHKFVSKYNVPDPILVGNQVFLAGSHTPSKCALLDISTTTPTVMWTNNNLSSPISTSVHVDGYLYGSKGTKGSRALAGLPHPFRCVDLATGQIMWEKEMVVAPVTVAGGKLIILEANGTLRIAEATPASYTEISSCEVLLEKGVKQFFTPPVLYKGEIYCRNYAGDLVCIDVSNDS